MATWRTIVGVDFATGVDLTALVAVRATKGKVSFLPHFGEVADLTRDQACRHLDALERAWKILLPLGSPPHYSITSPLGGYVIRFAGRIGTGDTRKEALGVLCALLVRHVRSPAVAEQLQRLAVTVEGAAQVANLGKTLVRVANACERKTADQPSPERVAAVQAQLLQEARAQGYDEGFDSGREQGQRDERARIVGLIDEAEGQGEQHGADLAVEALRRIKAAIEGRA